MAAAVGFLIAVAIPFMGYSLPTAEDPSTILTVGMGTLSSIALLLSGISLLVSSSSVSAGYLYRKKANMARAMQVGMSAGSIFCTGIFLLFYVSSIATSVDYPGEPRLRFTAGTIVYIFLPVIAAVITVVDLVVAHVLFFPSDSKLRKFNPPGPAFR